MTNALKIIHKNFNQIVNEMIDFYNVNYNSHRPKMLYMRTHSDGTYTTFTFDTAQNSSCLDGDNIVLLATIEKPFHKKKDDEWIHRWAVKKLKYAVNDLQFNIEYLNMMEKNDFVTPF